MRPAIFLAGYSLPKKSVYLEHEHNVIGRKGFGVDFLGFGDNNTSEVDFVYVGVRIGIDFDEIAG